MTFIRPPNTSRNYSLGNKHTSSSLACPPAYRETSMRYMAQDVPSIVEFTCWSRNESIENTLSETIVKLQRVVHSANNRQHTTSGCLRPNNRRPSLTAISDHLSAPWCGHKADPVFLASAGTSSSGKHVSCECFISAMKHVDLHVCKLGETSGKYIHGQR